VAAPTVRTAPRALTPLLAAAVVVCDQLTKQWAADELADGHVIDLVWTLRLNLVYNSGSAFSIGRGLGPLLGVLAVVVVLVLVRMGRLFNSRATAVALGAVLGGAIGNLTDRAFREGSGSFLGGYVIDFVDFQWWPVFNVADIAIVCGAIGLAWFSTRTDFDAPADPAPADAAPYSSEVDADHAVPASRDHDA
jgi:signal peptidase II